MLYGTVIFDDPKPKRKRYKKAKRVKPQNTYGLDSYIICLLIILAATGWVIYEIGNIPLWVGIILLHNGIRIE